MVKTNASNFDWTKRATYPVKAREAKSNPARKVLGTLAELETSVFSNCLRQPDNLSCKRSFQALFKETHGFASLPRSRFAIYRVQSLQKIVAAPCNFGGSNIHNH
jgi:hypothetical protein